MPRGSPFTALCQQTARITRPRIVADLHTHTTASDGDYTASQLVAFAVRSKLTTLAITDHDAISTIEVPPQLEFVQGVEITTQWEQRETHLLAYFMRSEINSGIHDLLAQIRVVRRRRFHFLVQQLSHRGIDVDVSRLDPNIRSLGRRHLAQLLLQQGYVRNIFTAFRDFLAIPSDFLQELPTIADTIRVVHQSGGMTSLAHPRDDLSREQLQSLVECGLDAVEVAHATIRYGRSILLRSWASDLGLAVTGGSDCHGTDRAIGSEGITCAELDRLRRLAESRQFR